MADQNGLALLLGAVFAPVVLGLLSLLTPRGATGARTVVALLGPVLSVLTLGMFVSGHGVLEQGAAIPGFALAPSMGVWLTFFPDALSTFFGFLVAGVGALIVLYARGYFGDDDVSLRRFFPTLGFFATAMMGLVLADNMLAMLIFWELTSVSSFLLIGWNRDDRNSVRLAVQALVTTGLGGLALLGGVVMLGGLLDTWSLQGAIALIGSGELTPEQRLAMPWAFALLFLGGATKSAQWPFHYWLPGAMAAPTPVSAYLHSATMVKAGVYLFGRVAPAMSGLEAWGPTLTIVGAITMLLGGFLALRSDELKKIFAYTTVSQLGLFTCMYGLAAWEHHHEPNLIWPVTQILNHALYKAPLFIVAGAILKLAGRKKLSELAGLFRTHRTIALVCLAALYAMAGGPLTLSFTAKEAFLYQAYHAAEHANWVWIIAAMAVLTAACNVAIFVRFLVQFLSVPDADAPHGKAVSGFWGACVWWPAAALVLWQYVGGLAPGVFESIVRPVETNALYFEHLPSLLHAVSHPGVPLGLSALAIALGVVVGLSPLLRTVFADPHDRLFPASDRAFSNAGASMFRWFQTGNFRLYVYLTLLALLIGVAASIFYDARFGRLPYIELFDGLQSGIVIAAFVTAILVCGTTISLPIVRSRITRVLVLGAAGFAVTSIYFLYRAPDLALTQLMFEIISVLLFLLVLRMLPEEPQARPKGGRLGRALFGAVCGLGMGWIVLQIGGVADADPGNGRLGDWFIAHSYEGEEDTDMRGAGGDNVVNTILVDFRGYDTLGEITVLAIAAMGVFVLIGRAKGDPRGSGVQDEPAPGGRATSANEGHTVRTDARGVVLEPQPALTSMLVRTSMRLILPLSLIFAGYVFFKGHNEPGGGFIAGLIAAVAFAVYRMSEGKDALRKLLPVKPGPLAAIGLAIALTTATIPLLLGYEFMRSSTAYVSLPGGGVYHWASVVFFDLGVLIVVVAVSVGIINRLTEELE